MTRPGALFPRGAETRAALRRAGVLTAVGFIGLLPAVVLVAAGVTDRQVPSALVHPVLVLSGLVASFGASFVAVTHWETGKRPDQYRITCTIRKRPADLFVLVASLVLLAIIVGYLFVENYQPR